MELHAVRALLADDLGMVGVLLVGDEDGAALPHAVVLGLVEAVAAEVPECAEAAPFVGGHHALRRILDDKQVVLSGDFVDGVHLAGHARIVHRHDGLRLFGDGRLDELLVDVHRVGADVHEHALRAAQRERIGRGNERERRHNDLVTRPDTAKQRGHLERMRAARGQQGARAARLAFEPSVALLVELPVAANAAALDGLPHIIDFGPHEGRLVERNSHMVKYIIS